MENTKLMKFNNLAEFDKLVEDLYKTLFNEELPVSTIDDGAPVNKENIKIFCKKAKIRYIEASLSNPGIIVSFRADAIIYNTKYCCGNAAEMVVPA